MLFTYRLNGIVIHQVQGFKYLHFRGLDRLVCIFPETNCLNQRTQTNLNPNPFGRLVVAETRIDKQSRTGLARIVEKA